MLSHSIQVIHRASIMFLYITSALRVRSKVPDRLRGKWLAHFPLSKRKIDRSFVSDAPSDASDASIVAAILALGQSMRLADFAEG